MKSKKILTMGLSLLLAVLSACSTNQQPASTPTPDGTAQVQAGMDRYNQYVTQMNVDGIVALFAPDGQIYDTGQLKASGLDAVRTYLQNSYAAVHIDSYTTTADPIFMNGGVAAAIGTFEEKSTTLATNQSVKAKGHYTIEWVLQSNGEWLIHRLSTDVVP